MSEKLSTNLQESVLTLLCVNDEEGAIAAGIVDTELFEPPYDDIATRAINYRNKFGKAPGTAHLDDLFDHVLSDPKNKQARIYQGILGGIIEQSRGFNAKYVLDRVNTFIRQQHLKVVVLEAAQRYQVGGDDLVPDIERILQDALRFKVEALDAGTFLNDKKRALAFITNPQVQSYALGIAELDRRNIGPTRGKAFGFMAPAGRGKTWFCVDTSVRCLLQHARVCHISLEMGEEELMQRYMQRMFAVAKRNEKFKTTVLEFDELNRLSGFTPTTVRPRLNFQDPKILSKLGHHLADWGVRGKRLVVKQFPTSQLSVAQLKSYLDALELTTGFVPDVLIVDYPKLMNLDSKQDRRIAIGMAHEQLRGICVERGIAGIFPVQSNRDGEKVKLLTRETIGEDYSIVQTMDFLVTFNQTEAEHASSLARLYVDKARSDEDRLTILIAQAYRTGQFAMQSTYMPSGYWDRLKALGGKPAED